MFLIDELKKCIKDKKAILIVGGGVSIAATWKSECVLERLIGDGDRTLRLRRFAEAEEGLARVMTNLLEIGYTEDWLLIAEQVQRRLRGGELISWLRDWSEGLQVKNNRIIEAIGDLGVPITTTNYDMLIENVTS